MEVWIEELVEDQDGEGEWRGVSAVKAVGILVLSRQTPRFCLTGTRLAKSSRSLYCSTMCSRTSSLLRCDSGHSGQRNRSELMGELLGSGHIRSPGFTTRELLDSTLFSIKPSELVMMIEALVE